MVKRILLARHAETTSNRDWIFQGQTDSPLTALGRRQAKALGEAISIYQPDSVFCSDLGRAKETLRGMGLPRTTRLFYSSLLREKSYGVLEGVPWKRVNGWREYHADPYKSAEGGESMLDVAKRLLPFFRKIQQRREETVLIVTHHNPLAVLLCDFLGMHYKEWRRFKLSLAGVSEVVFEEGLWRVAKLNETGHLGDLKSVG